VVARTGPQMAPDGGGGDMCVRVDRAVPCFLPAAGLRRHHRLERACSSTAHCLQRSAKGGYAVACSAPAIVARGGACVHGWVTPKHPDMHMRAYECDLNLYQRAPSRARTLMIHSGRGSGNDVGHAERN
jgi:hypothetical protein